MKPPNDWKEFEGVHGAWHSGPCSSYTTAQYTIPGGELCNICGLIYYSRSAGGPNVCPGCDCGFTGATLVAAQRQEIERLRGVASEWEANYMRMKDKWLNACEHSGPREGTQ